MSTAPKSASTNSASFFKDKVDAVMQNTARVPEPTCSTARSGASLVSFSPVSVDNLVSANSRMPDKSSAADPLPGSLMKLVTEEIAPVLIELFNLLLIFPEIFGKSTTLPVHFLHFWLHFLHLAFSTSLLITVTVFISTSCTIPATSTSSAISFRGPCYQDPNRVQSLA